MVERITTFLVIGFFVFSPEVQSFWSVDPLQWYANYLVWFGVIALAWLAVRIARRRSR